MDKTLVLGECKWNNHPIGANVIKDLIPKTDKVLPRDGHWKVYFLDLARDFSDRGVRRRSLEGFGDPVPRRDILPYLMEIK